MAHGERINLVDHDFMESLQALKEIHMDATRTAISEGDEKKENYLLGVIRGIELCLETYQICLTAEEKAVQEQPQKLFKYELQMLKRQ